MGRHPPQYLSVVDGVKGQGGESRVLFQIMFPVLLLNVPNTRWRYWRFRQHRLRLSCLGLGNTAR